MQVNAVAAAEGDVKEDDVPAVRVEPDDCGTGEDRNNRQGSA
jgi:hypothetical protein